MFPEAVAVKVEMVGTVDPEMVKMALELCVKVVTVGWAPEKVRPVLDVMLLVRLVMVYDWVPLMVWALVSKV